MAKSKGARSRFGSIRALPSGRIQARYSGPDGRSHSAPTTFDTKGDAEAWLATVRADIVREAWNPNTGTRRNALTLGTYANKWLEGRRLEARSREHYRRVLDRFILPELGRCPSATSPRT